jgi:hypothetical protein
MRAPELGSGRCVVLRPTHNVRAVKTNTWALFGEPPAVRSDAATREGSGSYWCLLASERGDGAVIFCPVLTALLTTRIAEPKACFRRGALCRYAHKLRSDRNRLAEKVYFAVALHNSNQERSGQALVAGAERFIPVGHLLRPGEVTHYRANRHPRSDGQGPRH